MSINKSYVLAGALVATSSIVMPMAEKSQVEAATQTVTVTSRVNFRKGPSMNYSITVSYTHLTLPTNREV